MIELPNEVLAPKNPDIEAMVVFGFNKVGKTESLLQLPNSFMLDLEGSGGDYKGTYLTLKDIMNRTSNCYTASCRFYCSRE